MIELPLNVLMAHAAVGDEDAVALRQGNQLRFVSPSGISVEIVIRTPEEQGKREICEIFGDIVKGFTLSELEMVLKEDPTVKILPD